MTSEAPYRPWTAYLTGPGFHVGEISFCFCLSHCYSESLLLTVDPTYKRHTLRPRERAWTLDYGAP